MTFERLPYITNAEALLADVRRRCLDHLERWRISPADAGNAYRVWVDHGYVVFDLGPLPLELPAKAPASADAAVRLFVAADAWTKYPPRSEAADALRAVMDRLHQEVVEATGDRAEGGRSAAKARRQLPDAGTLQREREKLIQAGTRPHNVAAKLAGRYGVTARRVRQALKE